MARRNGRGLRYERREAGVDPHPTASAGAAAILDDPVPAVRLQFARNLQILCLAAPEAMWTMAQKLATDEPEVQVLTSFLNHALRRFAHSEPERCETILAIVRSRLASDFAGDPEKRDTIQESFGGWVAQLYAGQGRDLLRTWLEEWALDPVRFDDILNHYSSSLRSAYFYRYDPAFDPGAHEMCDRAQAGLATILVPAAAMSAEAYGVLVSDAGEEAKTQAGKRYGAAEKVLHHAMNQLYFGSGAHGGDRDEGPWLSTAQSKARFLEDYAGILALLTGSHEPATLHHLIELYEFLISGDPVAVFEAFHAILLGRGEEEGYQHESMGNTAVVRIVQRYIADHRTIFEDDGRRARLVAILHLFSEVGWTEALKLLYELPDLLR